MKLEKFLSNQSGNGEKYPEVFCDSWLLYHLQVPLLKMPLKICLKSFLNLKARNYLVKKINTKPQEFSNSLKLELDVLFYGFDYEKYIVTCLSVGHKTW